MKYKKVCVYCKSYALRNKLTPICQSCFDEQMEIKVKDLKKVASLKNAK